MADRRPDRPLPTESRRQWVVLFALLCVAALRSGLAGRIASQPATSRWDGARWSTARRWRWVVAVPLLVLSGLLAVSVSLWGWSPDPHGGSSPRRSCSP